MRDAVVEVAGEIIPFTSDPLIEGIVGGLVAALSVRLLYDYYREQIHEPVPCIAFGPPCFVNRAPDDDPDAGGGSDD